MEESQKVTKCGELLKENASAGLEINLKTLIERHRILSSLKRRGCFLNTQILPFESDISDIEAIFDTGIIDESSVYYRGRKII